MKALTEILELPEAQQAGVTLHIRREDLLFPDLSGNKYRKLKYNLEAAREAGANRLLTFGGAYSNHIHAVAAAGKAFGWETVGLIRGEELAGAPRNPTLQDAEDNGMHLVFLTRSDYRRRNDPDFVKTCLERYGPAYVLPEGGSNALALRGCSEILQPGDEHYNTICCATGTGGTLAGLALGAKTGQRVRGYAVVRDPGLESQLSAWAPGAPWTLVRDYDFGGYAKVPPALVAFVNAFRERTGIPLDPVYTGKMLFGVLEDLRSGRLAPGSRVLLIHTGGLQGIRGVNRELQKKNLPLLQV